MADKDFRVKNGIVVGTDVFISNSITSVNTISFNTNGYSGGELRWNSSDGTLDIQTGYGDVVLQTGQETHYVVRNATASTILNGTALYCSSVTVGSGRIEASPMIGDGSISPVQFLGLATHNITNGVNGVVTYFGYVRDLDTRGTANTAISVGDETWAVGDKLYVHPTADGKLTNVEPEAPNSKICVASITTRHGSVGVLFVRPTTNLTLHKLSDVQINNLVNGDVLTYVSANARFENKTVSGTSSDSFKTISVAGQSNVVAASSTDVLTLVAGSGMSITTDAATDTITLTSTSGGGGDVSNAWVNANDYTTLLSAYANDAALYNSIKTFNVFSVAGQANVIAQSFGSQLIFVAGPNVTIATNATANSITIDSVGGGGGAGTSSNSFTTIAVAGQNNVVANTSTEVLTFISGSNMTITTNAETDTITFASTGGGGGGTDEFARTIAFLGL